MLNSSVSENSHIHWLEFTGLGQAVGIKVNNNRAVECTANGDEHQCIEVNFCHILRSKHENPGLNGADSVA